MKVQLVRHMQRAFDRRKYTCFYIYNANSDLMQSCYMLPHPNIDIISLTK